MLRNRFVRIVGTVTVLAGLLAANGAAGAVAGLLTPPPRAATAVQAARP